ncbi:hypothetical protein K1719_000038 [Acacia pycnantha]|nr:hypothetical protein K1719_000038 [Acacia pycnantha]
MCGTLFELLGVIVLWLTAIIHNARPPHCNLYTEACATPSTGQVLFLLSSLVLLAIGAGGIKPCSLAFSADQFNNPENLNNERIMKSFFNWYYISVGVSVALSVTVIVYIQIKTGWVVGFGITVGLMLFYTFMFLNKACIIKNRVKDLDSNRKPINPWNLRTVRQVEELKILIKVIPIWSTSLIVSIIISQYTFLVVQAGTMNRHLIFNFEIPAPNLTAFSIISMTIWVTIYDRVLVPLLSRSKHPRIRRGFTLKQRMGIGLALTVIAIAIASQVERKRRSLAVEERLVGNPKGVVNMSVWWLVPQLCITGLAEGFNITAQIEFYYTHFPKSMSSVAMPFFYAGWGIGNVLGSVIVKTVKVVTERRGRNSWLASSPNNSHYDYYYGLHTILGVINLLYFFVCSWTYGTTQDIENWDDEFESNLQSNKEVDPRRN